MVLMDMHVHTRPGSGDSSTTYEDLVPWARKAGLGGICITEHGASKTGVAERLSREYDFLVLEGMESSTELGDILLFGLESVPRNLYRAEEVWNFVQKSGGLMFVAHPFRAEITRPILQKSTPRLTMEEALKRPIFHLVDGLEVANGWCAAEDVAFCAELCSRLGLRGIAGSDSHMPRQIGCCATVFENGIRTEADLVMELRRGNYQALDRRTVEQKVPTYWFS